MLTNSDIKALIYCVQQSMQCRKVVVAHIPYSHKDDDSYIVEDMWIIDPEQLIRALKDMQE